MKINAQEKRSYRVHEQHQTLGDVLRVGPNTVYFNDPRAVSDIYGHKAISKIGKDTFYDRLAGDFHDIVQERDRSEHSRKRKYLSNAFALATVVDMEPVIRANFQNMLDRLESFIDSTAKEKTEGDRFNIRQWFNFFTLDVIGDMAFGLPMGFTKAGVRYSITVGQITSFRLNGILKQLAKCSGLIYSSTGSKDADDFEYMSLHQLRNRLDKGGPERSSGDFIGKILSDKDGKSRSLPLGEMLAESVVMMNAGSDTTAAALTNTTYYLLSNPRCLAKLRKELQEAIPADHQGIVEYNYVRSLPYLRACIDESLRMRPPITYPPRLVYAPEGATVAGHFLKQGTVVAVSPYTIHRNETVYKDPDTYDPDRWFDPDQVAALKAYNIPFSTGSRACIGRHIAIVELQILISTLMLKYDLALEPGQELDVFERFNANPGPLPITAQRRSRDVESTA
ncbi:unnamed protein product [Parascedosporium putredinis]|uniref:Cytochrome P450 n=1 Tax=Parascedosporium putredinis TaxID=1442378 RepID=A0A9P1H4U0_9PEZI|nr:unnamed protein product [Parascedosporium putredinis]CAI7997000.1 unnamed protein product [Parascedosporium putredinis]